MTTSFESHFRVHMGLTVTDLGRSIAFYTTLLGAPPVKVRDGYAKFEPNDPCLNLSLHLVDAVPEQAAEEHYGLQVKSTDDVMTTKARLAEAGLATRSEEHTECCYSVQDKVWVQDPDGRPWEIFVVLEADSALRKDPESACCATDGEDQRERAASCCG